MTPTPTPTVSIVVPAYRNRATIARAVSSVLAQTFTDLELVVGDQASEDGTLEVLAAFDDPRLRVLSTPAGGGAQANWNAVTNEARAPYLKLVCADDVLRPDCLQRQVSALQADPRAVMVASRRDVVDPSDAVLLAGRGLGTLEGHVAGGTAIRALVRAGTNLLGEPACALVRTEAVRAVGGWSARQPYFIDEDLYIRVLRRGDLIALPETLAAFRVSNTQWSARLVGDQARQARAFHRRVKEENPEHVTTSDLLQGLVRGSVLALQRRVAYLVWARRLRAVPAEIR